MKPNKTSKKGRRQFLKTVALFASGVSFLPVTGASIVLGENDSSGQPEAPPMPHRQLGRTGASISILQLGGAQRFDPVYDKVMHLCFREGVTGIDTALGYGRGASHEAIANFFTQIGDRKKLFITSKSGGNSAKELIADIDKCLQQLKTDYIDLYLMHGINSASMLSPEFIQAGEALRKSGKTRFFGFSTHGGNVVDLMNQAARSGGIDAILFRYNFRQYGDKPLNLAIDACKKSGIGLIAMKTMGSVPDNAEAAVRFTSKDFTLAQAKLKSVWADERIDTVVCEMTNTREAKENIAAARSFTPLSAREIHQLNRLSAMTSHLSCNGCAHICEQAIHGKAHIADQLRFLMYHECYGKTDSARELYRALPLEARRLNEKEIEIAARLCPQGIDIAAHLTKARLELEG